MRVLVVTAAVAALAAVACPGAPPGEESPARGDADASAPEPTETSRTEGVFRMQGCEPRSLLPAAADTRCGHPIVAALFTPLVEHDVGDGAPRWGDRARRAVAERITSIDARRWVIELEPGWTFHDGEPVTSASFVDAWNFAAYGPNAQPSAFLFDQIVGFGAVNCPDVACEPAAETMAGLRTIGDLTLEVTLRTPDRDFPARLSHLAFSPLPRAALDNPADFVEAPIGNGPLRIDGAWEHEVAVRLRAVEDYPDAPAASAGVDVRFIDDAEAAWEALHTGDLDVADRLPADRLDDARTGLGWVVAPGDDYEFLVVPAHRPELGDPRLAEALSRAIDRRSLIREHLDGRARPAQGLAPPVVSNEVDRCGPRCRFDPATARSLLEEAGLPEGGIELWHDRDAPGQGDRMRAVARQWREHLGLEPHEVRVRSLPHTRWLSHLQDRRLGGIYALGWTMDVPSAGEYLRELHGPGGLFNFDGHRNPEAMDLLEQAGRAATDREARLALRRAEQLLLADMHHVPLWVRTHEVFHTLRVGRLTMDAKGRVVLADVTISG